MPANELELKLNTSDLATLLQQLREIGAEADKAGAAVKRIGASLGVSSPGGGVNVASGGGAQGTTSRAAGNVAGSAQPVSSAAGIQTSNFGFVSVGTPMYNLLQQQGLAGASGGATAAASSGAQSARPIPVAPPLFPGVTNIWTDPNSPLYQQAQAQAFSNINPVAGGAGGRNMGMGNYGPAGMYTPTYSRLPGMMNPLPGYTARQGMIASAAAVGGAAYLGVQATNLYAQQTASGDYDPMAGAGLWGQGIGAAAGGVIGAIASPGAPGTGFATGMLAGGVAGRATAEALIAGAVRDNNARRIIQSTVARTGTGDDLFNSGSQRMTTQGGSIQTQGREADGRLKALSEMVTNAGKSPDQLLAIRLGIYTGNDIMSSIQAANIYSSIGSAGLSAGLVNSQNDLLRGTYNIGMKYGGAGGQRIAGLAGPAIAAINRSGGNATDILMAAGPESYGAMTDVYGAPDLSRRQLAAYGGVQRGAYQAASGAAQIRGSGFASAAGYASQLGSLSQLPGGSDSLAYKQATRQLADSVTEGFAQSNMTSFGVPRAQIEGQQQRAQLLPYMPSRMFEIAGRGIALNNREIGALRSQMSTMESAGLLDESTQLQYTQRIESLRTSNASQLAMLSEGRENLLPGLVAGRRRSVGAVDSGQLAALSYSRAGLPFRGRGAINGGALAVQNAYADLVMGGGDVGPASRTSGINNMAGGGRTDDLLAAILAAIKSGGFMQGQRPNSSIGQSYGAAQTRDLQQGNTRVDRGSY